uniref:Uncharacterized protein n=1 Tax=Glossina pallidipes TaxID=7398 RepID=A0A1A9ZYN6_GLOPL
MSSPAYGQEHYPYSFFHKITGGTRYELEEEYEEEEAYIDPLLNSKFNKNIEDPEIITDEKPSTSGSSVGGKRKPLLERNVKKGKPKKKCDMQELVDRAERERRLLFASN